MSLRTLIECYGLWVAVLAVPLALNIVVWFACVVPQQARLRTWHEAQAVGAIRPKLEALLEGSQRLLADWERTGFTTKDPSAVMQAVQRLAGTQKVQIAQISAKGRQGKGQAAGPGERIPPGFSAMPIELEVTGRFSRLAHWMSATEAQSGLQIDSWTMASSSEKEANPLTRLTVTLTAFLRES